MVSKRVRGKATPAEPPSKKARTAPLAAIEVLDVEESPDTKAKAEGKKRTEGATFSKLIMDNFLEHGFTEEEVQCAVCADGTGLIDKLAADRAAWESGLKTMGQNYYRDLRKECRNPNSDFAKLEEAQKESVVDDELEDIDFYLLFIVILSFLLSLLCFVSFRFYL